MPNAILCFAETLRSNARMIVDYILAIATLGTAFAAFLTIGAMKRQQRASYTPQLFPGNALYVIRKDSKGVPFVEEQGTESDDYPTYAMHLAPVPFRNIGLGAAHSIVVGWEYDRAVLVGRLEQLGQQSGLISKGTDEHLRFASQPDEKKDFGFVVRAPSEHDRRIASLTPGETIVLHVPDSILNYLAFRTVAESVTATYLRREFDEHGITVALQYMDIGGRVLRKSVPVHIHVLSYDPPNATPGSDHAIVSFQFFLPDAKKSWSRRRMRK